MLSMQRAVLGEFRRETGEKIRVEYCEVLLGTNRGYIKCGKGKKPVYEQKLRIFVNDHEEYAATIEQRTTQICPEIFDERANTLEARVRDILHSRVEDKTLHAVLTSLAKSINRRSTKKPTAGRTTQEEPPLGKSLLDGSDLLIGGSSTVNENNFYVPHTADG